LLGAADSYCFGGHWATPTPVCHGRYIMSVMKGTSCFEQQNRIVLVVFKIKDVKNDTISATPLLHFLF
jgi:hypothetical protein